MSAQLIGITNAHAGPDASSAQAERSSAPLALAIETTRRIVSLVRSVLREIFDESAYSRFLQRTGQMSSPAAYGAFLQEGSVARARRPRCC